MLRLLQWTLDIYVRRNSRFKSLYSLSLLQADHIYPFRFMWEGMSRRIPQAARAVAKLEVSPGRVIPWLAHEPLVVS
jgi:hypothetical protein